MESVDNSKVQNLLSFWAKPAAPAIDTDKQGETSFADLLNGNGSNTESGKAAKDVKGKPNAADRSARENEFSNKRADDKTENKEIDSKRETKDKVSSKDEHKQAKSADKPESKEMKNEGDSSTDGAAYVKGEVEDVEAKQDKSFFVLDLSAIAALPSVVVVDAATGEETIMSGKEFVEMLKAMPEMPEVMFVDENGNKSAVDLSGIEWLAADEVMEFTPVMDEEGNVIAVAPKADDAKVMVEDEAALAKQAAKFAEIIGEDSKVKIEVNTAEKKVYVYDTKGPLIDKEEPQALTELVEAQPDFEPKKDERLEQAQSIAEAMAEDAEGVDAPQMHMVDTVKVPATDATAAATDGIEAIAAKTSATASHFSAAEVNALKADASGGDKSFREVYKGMSQDIIDQVKVNITKSAVKGIDKIDIQLKPEGLGKVEVNLQINKDGKLQANITSSKPEALEALQKDAASLEKALNDAGFNTDSGSLNFSLREEQNNQQQKDLRAFMGEALRAQEDNTAEMLPETWDGKSALNIRV